jgi:hypothetical protein
MEEKALCEVYWKLLGEGGFGMAGQIWAVTGLLVIERTNLD